VYTAYGDGAGNTVEENSTVFSLIHSVTGRMLFLPTSQQRQSTEVVVVLKWECWLTQVVLYNGRKTVVVGSFVCVFQTPFSDFV